MTCPMDQFIDNIEWNIWHDRTGMSFEQKFEAQKEVHAMRAAAMKIRFNAHQFNRRAEWMRKTGRSADMAAQMFPASI